MFGGDKRLVGSQHVCLLLQQTTATPKLTSFLYDKPLAAMTGGVLTIISPLLVLEPYFGCCHIPEMLQGHLHHGWSCTTLSAPNGWDGLRAFGVVYDFMPSISIRSTAESVSWRSLTGLPLCFSSTSSRWVLSWLQVKALWSKALHLFSKSSCKPGPMTVSRISTPMPQRWLAAEITVCQLTACPPTATMTPLPFDHQKYRFLCILL